MYTAASCVCVCAADCLSSCVVSCGGSFRLPVGEGYLMMPGSCLHAARPSVMSSAAETRTDLRSMSLDLRMGGRFDTALEFCVTAGAVRYLALQLSAGGIDVFAAGAADHRLYAGVQQDGLEIANDRFVRAFVLRTGERIERNQIHLGRQAAHQLDELLCQHRRVVDALHQCVFEGDRR